MRTYAWRIVPSIEEGEFPTLEKKILDQIIDYELIFVGCSYDH